MLASFTQDQLNALKNLVDWHGIRPDAPEGDNQLITSLLADMARQVSTQGKYSDINVSIVDQTTAEAICKENGIRDTAGEWFIREGQLTVDAVFYGLSVTLDLTDEMIDLIKSK